MDAIIVEDSRLARQELKHLLKDIPEVTIIGEAVNADEALKLIPQLKPDLLFLDIQMPGKNGFELLEELDNTPHVIFTTAYDQYALKAFDYNALDYLQKPISKDRLAAALEKVSNNQLSTTSEQSEDPEQVKRVEGLTSDSQVFVKDGDNCWFVKLAQIRLFEVDGSYTKIHFEDHHPMIPKTLNYLETRVDPKTFFRANRQQMINLKHIDKIEPWFSGGIKIYLKGGEEIEVSRRQATKFKELMSF